MNASRTLLLSALVGLALGLTVLTGGWGNLYNETDGQYGGAAKVMAEGGSWLVPLNNDIPRLVKPPLLYWAMAGSMQVFGVNEFAARLPGALSWCAVAVLTFLLGERLGGSWRGFVAGAVMLTGLGTFTLGRIVMPEPTFVAFIVGALYCAVTGADTGRRGWFLGFWVCAALASFVKGWHGLLYPLAIVLVLMALDREARRRYLPILSWQGLLIFLVINVPWYAYIEWRFPGYLGNLIYGEQIGHIVGSHAPATDYTNVPRWQFLLLHVAWFFPWLLLALTARRDSPATSSSLSRLVWIWAVLVLASVLLTGQRQDYYAMAMWPAAALIFSSRLQGRIPRWAVGVLAAVLVAGAVFCIWGVPKLTGASSTASVSERSTAWNTVVNFDAGVWKSLWLTAVLAVGGAAIAAVAAVIVQGKARFLAVLAVAISLDLGALSGTAIVAPYFSLGTLEDELAQFPKARVVFDGDIDTASSLLFYCDLPVVLLNRNPNQDFIVRKFGIGRDRFVDQNQLKALWDGNQPLLFVAEKRDHDKWANLLGVSGLRSVGDSGTQVLFWNGR
ncbi:4-amino-4-deoxy-L-arabinose transferase [Terrimicrobium sacchariphilum]|uniref:4-amino-4-deoxy-L-arabinose transferase n=1 Tax=Terrimicrobium sacchariphilum TaxID=690879 RepID=A0A146G7P9_TERSA|nr:glycosyltransferase family 39 protein [Terrimicrobium sacchariphilum]GAT33373.1 4-amino-4-deoxy-L-arabinose transferase [Terrimicrobium sacchariphilum]